MNITESMGNTPPPLDPWSHKEPRTEQNLLLGIGGGLAAALLGAALWAGISYATSYQIGWIAIGLGVLVGTAMRLLGKGTEPAFGVIGGFLSGASCLLGNVILILLYLADQFEMPLLDVLINIRWSVLPDLLIETSSPIDLLFYGLAIYIGYRSAFQAIGGAETPEMEF